MDDEDSNGLRVDGVDIVRTQRMHQAKAKECIASAVEREGEEFSMDDGERGREDPGFECG